VEEEHQRNDSHNEKMGEMGQSFHRLHIFAKKEWEVSSLVPQNQEEEPCSSKELSSPPSYPLEVSSEPFSLLEVLSQWHGESDTCQTGAQISFYGRGGLLMMSG
jgi:hypothetical protein